MQLGRWRFIAAATAIALCSFGLTATAASAANFTWTGVTPAPAPGASNWSKLTNWEGGLGAPSGSVEKLIFPELTSGFCTAEPPTSACYESNNDVSGLSATGLVIDDGVNYNLSGNPITLGVEGIVAAPPCQT